MIYILNYSYGQYEDKVDVLLFYGSKELVYNRYHRYKHLLELLEKRAHKFLEKRRYTSYLSVEDIVNSYLQRLHLPYAYYESISLFITKIESFDEVLVNNPLLTI